MLSLWCTITPTAMQVLESLRFAEICWCKRLVNELYKNHRVLQGQRQKTKSHMSYRVLIIVQVRSLFRTSKMQMQMQNSMLNHWSLSRSPRIDLVENFSQQILLVPAPVPSHAPEQARVVPLLAPLLDRRTSSTVYQQPDVSYH